MASRTCTALFLFATVLLHVSIIDAAGFTIQIQKGPKGPANPVPQQPANPVPPKPVNPVPPKPVNPVPQQPANPIPPKPVNPVPQQPANPIPPKPVNPVPQQPANPIPPKPVNPVPQNPANPVPHKPADPAPQKPAEKTFKLTITKKASINVNINGGFSKPPGAVPQQPATVVVNKEAPKPVVSQQPAVVIMNKDAAAAATVVLKNEPARPHADPKFGIPISHSWCIPKPTLTVAQLEANIKEICAEKRINCGPIDAGRECFDNNNVWTRASFAMNSHFRLLGRCDFNQTGAVSLTNPSFGACKFL